MNTRKHVHDQSHDQSHDQGDEDVMDRSELDDDNLDVVSGGSIFGTDPDGNLLDKNGLAASPRHMSR
jgi:hypothetical protein